MTKEERELIMKALLKRASGYTAHECVEEYGAGEDGSAVFIKRRETEKDVPGDVGAAKLLLELDARQEDGYAAYSDEKLALLCRELAERLGDVINDK